MFHAGRDAAVEALVPVIDYASRRREAEVCRGRELLVLVPLRGPAGRRRGGLQLAVAVVAAVTTAGIDTGEEGGQHQKQKQEQRLGGPAG